MIYLSPNSTSSTSYNNWITYYSKHITTCEIEVSSHRSQCNVNIEITCTYWTGCNCQAVATRIRTRVLERRDTRFRNFHYQVIISPDIVYNRSVHVSLNLSRMSRCDFLFHLLLETVESNRTMFIKSDFRAIWCPMTSQFKLYTLSNDRGNFLWTKTCIIKAIWNSCKWPSCSIW